MGTAPGSTAHNYETASQKKPGVIAHWIQTMTRTPEELAHTIRAIRPSRGEALAYLTARILTLESTRPDSRRLPELRAAHHEIECNRKKYE